MTDQTPRSSLPAAGNPAPTPPSVAALIAGIEQAGVAVDETAALAWLAAVAEAATTPAEFAVAGEGFGGHELALLDFDPAKATQLRRIGRLVATPAAADVRPALAIAGSAAQGRIQPYPADADFFERVHILAPTEAAARRRLAETLRATVARVQALDGFTLEEVVFGRLPAGTPKQALGWHGSGIAWSLAEVVAGAKTIALPDRPPLVVAWEEAAADPGFVKADWFLTDPALGGPARVSKVVDATWQAPDGRILSLDGAIDPDFQQVYLDADAAAIAAHLTDELTLAERERYLTAMEGEVATYVGKRPPNYGKVAKRLYNHSRLTGRHAEALFLRELLDEPPARLYQARTLLEVVGVHAGQDPVAALAALSALLDDLADALAADPTCRDAAAACRELERPPTAAAIRDALATLDRVLEERTSHAFGERLRGYPPLAALLDDIARRHPTMGSDT
jgi:hypothetical protein